MLGENWLERLIAPGWCLTSGGWIHVESAIPPPPPPPATELLHFPRLHPELTFHSVFARLAPSSMFIENHLPC